MRFTNNIGEMLALPDTATTTPDTGDKARPVFDTCIIGAIKYAGLIPNCPAKRGANSTNAKKAALPDPDAIATNKVINTNANIIKVAAVPRFCATLIKSSVKPIRLSPSAKTPAAIINHAAKCFCHPVITFLQTSKNITNIAGTS